MKNIIKQTFVTLVLLITALQMLLALSLLFRPLGDVVFSITLGSMYRKVGETALTIGGKTENAAIYKAAGKPFLLIGPYRFDEDYYDFFFVNQNQVIRTVTDKGGDAWFRFGWLLFMFDDMTSQDRVRMPYWDDLECDENSSVRYDDATASRVYSFKIRNATVPVTFAIPEKFLTQDMLDAPNDTRQN